MIVINGSTEYTSPLDRSLQKSLERKYFVGQTGNVMLATTNNGYAELLNPVGSGINVHINVFTISNDTADTTDETKKFIARIYFAGVITGTKTESTLITSANLTTPVSIAKAKINHISNTANIPSAGVQAFSRRVEGSQTVVSEEQGKFIIPPGTAFSISLTNSTDTITFRVAFGWWEEPI